MSQCFTPCLTLHLCGPFCEPLPLSNFTSLYLWTTQHPSAAGMSPVGRYQPLDDASAPAETADGAGGRAAGGHNPAAAAFGAPLEEPSGPANGSPCRGTVCGNWWGKLRSKWNCGVLLRCVLNTWVLLWMLRYYGITQHNSM